MDIISQAFLRFIVGVYIFEQTKSMAKRNDNFSIGAYLRSVRQEKKLSLKAVAETLNISVYQLGKIETNKYSASQDAIKALARLYKIPLKKITEQQSTGTVGKAKAKLVHTRVSKVVESPISYLNPMARRDTIRVAELFAGVGGFRLGLEGWQGKSASSKYTRPYASRFEVVWSNQWEPATKTQHASLVYENRFGSQGHSNQDIVEVDINAIPDHDMLVGGFPCQDYSVATTLKNSKGLLGKKGVLWWAIHKILSEKKNRPSFLFLENVDRLLISPSKQRGRDFAIILKSLNDLGYAVEWRVINAADYGMPQRRRRIFIVGYHQSTKIYKEILKANKSEWVLNKGIIAHAFPVVSDKLVPSEFEIEGDIVDISSNFNKRTNVIQFENSGLMFENRVTTIKTLPRFVGNKIVLRDIMQNGEVTEDFYIKENELKKWRYLKGAKKETRIKADGFEYHYSEGAMSFPDPIDKPSRTIITGEGGPSPSRFKHVVVTPKGYRRLSPVELERLNMFPDDHTKLIGVTDTKRAFFMGNALVVGVIEKIGIALANRI